MTVTNCDVLVVGLGPAGAAAAAAAARRGATVLAFDRKREIGVPVQCAEFIPLPLARHAQAPGVVAQPVRGMISRLPSGAEERTDFRGLMVDRAAFDRALVRAASESGARIMTRCRLLALDATGAIATLQSDSGEHEVRYRVLVAADGPHSPVGRAAGLAALATVNTRQYAVPLRVPFDDTDIWLSGRYPGGYAWLFPKGPAANLGLGMDPRFGGDMKAPLDGLHRMLVQEGRVGADILCRTGGPIPVGGLRERLVAGRILFAGDAAGLTHPISGAGIAAAVISGEMAGEAASGWIGGDAGALSGYESDIRDQFGEAIARGVARRRELETAWNTPRAANDAVHRRGWIAFPEFFAAA